MAGDNFSDHLTLEDVNFRFMLDISKLASNIRQSQDSGNYQTNADNLYWLVKTLWAINSFFIPMDAEIERLKLVKRAQKKFIDLKEAGEKTLVQHSKDKAVNITTSLSLDMLELLSKYLAQSGLLRERSGVATAGDRTIEISDGKILTTEEGDKRDNDTNISIKRLNLKSPIEDIGEKDEREENRKNFKHLPLEDYSSVDCDEEEGPLEDFEPILSDIDD